MTAPDSFQVGDRVAVLRGCRLPKVEEVVGYGIVEQVVESSEPIYFVSGFQCGRSSRELRLAK